MQKVFFVKNGELDEVNKLLDEGGTIADIRPVAESVIDARMKGTGDVYAYIVVHDRRPFPSLQPNNMHSYTSLVSEPRE